MKKGDDQLKDQLNEFIAQSKQDGEFDRLTQKYLSAEKSWQPQSCRAAKKPRRS